MRYSGVLFILGAAFFWGLIGVVSRFALGAGVSSMEAAFWRAAIGGGCFLSAAAVTRNLRVRSLHDVVWISLFGLCSLGIYFICYMYAVQHGGAALAAVLLYTAPAWVALFAFAFFRESLTPVKAAAICVSLAGVACLSFSTGDEAGGAAINVQGVGFGLLAGLLFSTQFIFTKKFIASYQPFTIFGYGMAVAAMAMFPLVDFTHKEPEQWLTLLFLGSACTFLPYLLYSQGIKRLDVTRASVLATFEPVIATFAAWYVWSEKFSALGWLGGAMVLFAVVILIRNK